MFFIERLSLFWSFHYRRFHYSSVMFLGAACPILFSFGLPVCNARPIYIYIYIYNMDLKKSLIIENLYNSNREV